jgi:hypothetical protein
MTTEKLINRLIDLDWGFSLTSEYIEILGLVKIFKNKQEIIQEVMLCEELNELISEYVKTPLEERE